MPRSHCHVSHAEGWVKGARGRVKRASVLGELRLQVQEEDVERARRVLDEQEGFSPLPDDFIPPEE